MVESSYTPAETDLASHRMTAVVKLQIAQRVPVESGRLYRILNYQNYDTYIQRLHSFHAYQSIRVFCI